MKDAERMGLLSSALSLDGTRFRQIFHVTEVRFWRSLYEFMVWIWTRSDVNWSFCPSLLRKMLVEYQWLISYKCLQLDHAASREIFQTQKLVKMSEINWIPTDDKRLKWLQYFDEEDNRPQKDLQIRITTCGESNTKACEAWLNHSTKAWTIGQ